MADNITLDSGTGGAVLATEDEASVHYQKVKLTASGSGTTEALSKAEDTAHSSGEHGIMPLVVRNDTLAALATTDGDYAPIQVNASGAIFVECSTVASHAVTNAGTFAVQIVDTSFAVADGNALGEGVLVQGDDGTDRKNINVDASTGDVQVDVTNTVTVDLGANNDVTLNANSGVDIGDVDVTSISAGSNLIGDVGVGVRTSGGTTIFRSIDLDEGTLEVVKASAGQIYWMHVMNLASAVRYVKIYNATSGTYGTGTPVLTFAIPTQGDSNGAGFTLSVPNGIAFATGISIGAGTGVADNDTGAPAANEVIVNIGYA